MKETPALRLAEDYIRTGKDFTAEERSVFYQEINALLPKLSSDALWNQWMMIAREVEDPLPDSATLLDEYGHPGAK